MRQLSEKYIGKGTNLHAACIELEELYGRFNNDSMWGVVRSA